MFPAAWQAGKARYVFFSFPHIAITPDGTLGTVGRPGQDKPNSACGALIAALGQLSAEGVEANLKEDTAHIPDDPEYSILKARIASRMNKVGLLVRYIPTSLIKSSARVSQSWAVIPSRGLTLVMCALTLQEKADPAKMDLADITKLAERQISDVR